MNFGFYSSRVAGDFKDNGKDVQTNHQTDLKQYAPDHLIWTRQNAFVLVQVYA